MTERTITQLEIDEAKRKIIHAIQSADFVSIQYIREFSQVPDNSIYSVFYDLTGFTEISLKMYHKQDKKDG